ncbi:uncharacterized protein Z519_01285 [Cladophialophora bantiana CBS 173.52]|uniref:N-acetyltransferase domain-containing protein n=1 Tax=Cladophialophora bantiana (strain ATCC 10958 / CBS 173.52 / CDC B-1940 / NIH 8579) TaxID=1442370 RepID=A0A0D2F674_CLAB1|nr:uncharacterized protein Z519_01285 [Cladophialophora bantiana CBS 173.52]KIW97701.1 hypothetical protein Z519_01285 [Cladophialophora bantiana CBS 173.52]
MGETGKGIDAEESQGDDVVTCQHGEQTEGDAEHESDDDDDDEIGDDDESDLDAEDESSGDTSEDEDRSEFDPDYEFEWLEPIDIEMEPPSRETSMLAFNLFDRYGRLRSEFKTHPVMKGTGVWGQELDHGDILLIEEVFVNKDYRRQGLGRRMIESLLTRAREKTWSFFAFVWPTFLRLNDLSREWDSLPDDAERHKLEEREHDRATTFYRSLGFRRLTSIEDFNPPKPPSTPLHALLTALQQIANPPPSRLDRILNPELRESPDFLDVLQNCMQQNGSADACWTSKGKYGNTVLHLIASIFNVACVEWVLKQGFGARLLKMRNSRGEVPLDLVQFKLEKLRTQKVVNQLTIPISDRFKGHNDIAAHLGHYMMNNDLDQWLGADWVEDWEDYLGYLPSRVLTNLITNKSMRQGFVNLWLHVTICLEKGDVPHASNVLDVVRVAREWPSATRNFLQRGGTVESVFLAIYREAIKQDKWTGDGEHQEIFSEEIANLPECRNDHEFGYVSGMCGYRRICLRPTRDLMGKRLDEDGNIIDSLQ